VEGGKGNVLSVIASQVIFHGRGNSGLNFSSDYLRVSPAFPLDSPFHPFAQPARRNPFCNRSLLSAVALAKDDGEGGSLRRQIESSPASPPALPVPPALLVRRSSPEQSRKLVARPEPSRRERSLSRGASETRRRVFPSRRVLWFYIDTSIPRYLDTGFSPRLITSIPL